MIGNFKYVWLDLACSRATYLPRTSAPNSERLYSGRSASPAPFLPFFIDLPLCARCLAGGNDSNRIILLRVGHHQKAPGGRHTKRHKTSLFERMIRIATCCRQRDRRTRWLLHRRIRRGERINPPSVYGACSELRIQRIATRSRQLPLQVIVSPPCCRRTPKFIELRYVYWPRRPVSCLT